MAKLGIEEFTRLVEEERKTLPHDDRWTAYLDDMPTVASDPVREPAPLSAGDRAPGFDEWNATNVYMLRQEGYALAFVRA